MARVTFEEKWWSDPRRLKLIERVGANVADGLAANMWRLAQEFWGRDHGLVPLEIFEHLSHSSALVECGLAEIRGISVYVRGSSEWLSWLHEMREQAREAGKKGGKVSAQRPRDAHGRLLPKPSDYPSESQANPSVAKPSGSGFSFKKETKGAQKAPKAPKEKLNPSLVAKYVENYSARYGRRPDVGGKTQGILLRIQGELGVEETKRRLEAYLRSDNEWFQKNAHDLATFENKQNVVMAEMDRGDPRKIIGICGLAPDPE